MAVHPEPSPTTFSPHWLHTPAILLLDTKYRLFSTVPLTHLLLLSVIWMIYFYLIYAENEILCLNHKKNNNALNKDIT